MMKVHLGQIFHIPYDEECDVICAITDGWGYVMSSHWDKPGRMSELDGTWVCPHRPDDCVEARENYLLAQGDTNHYLDGEEIEVVP
jgi:hypothetical protein